MYLIRVNKVLYDGLGKSTGSSGKHRDNNIGCAYHPDQTGHSQVMRKDGDPVCSSNGSGGKQRVCPCKGKYISRIMDAAPEHVSCARSIVHAPYF